MKRGTVIALFFILVIVAIISLEVQYSTYDYLALIPTMSRTIFPLGKAWSTQSSPMLWDLIKGHTS